MNKKVITAMMLGALVVSATSLTSCKDYDDDINNLQEQIDKAALKSDVEALKTQLATAQATADAAQKKAEANATDIAAVKDAAKTAGETAAKAVEAAAKAQSSADDAATVAKNAKELADAASKAAAANADAVEAIKKDLADAQAAIAKCATADELNKAITDAKADIEKTYATKADLNKTNEAVAKLQAESATAAALKDAVTKLEGEIAAAQPEGYKKLVETVASYKASINELYSALTGVELFATYTGSGLNVNGAKPTSLEMLHGIVGEDSKFGDNEAYKASDPIVAFVKGSEIAQNQGVIVKVNPVNVDLTKATVKLINSKGEVLDYVEAGTPEKYDYLITRAGNNVGGGLWKIPFKVKGADEEAFKKATQAEVNGQTKDILYAVAINNTDSAAERYVSSTYDVAPTYKKFAPLATLDYKVNDKDVADIHNRWYNSWNGYTAMTEDAIKFGDSDLAELTWKDGKPATAATDKNTVKDQSDARWGYSPLHVEVNQAFNIKLENTEAKYYYVTLDKDFAIESAPSEWNAWSSYSYEGLFKTTPADSTLSLKITSKAANGDIIGFRVFAVNADGTLLDPDGRAFYVQVGEAANTESVTGNDTITTANAAIYSAADLEDANKVNVVDMPLTKSFQSSTSNLSGVLNLDDATKGNLLGGESAYYILLDKDKRPAADWKDAKYVRVGVNNGGNWKDGTQISGTIKAVKDGNPTSAEVTLNTLVVTVKKVLPTTDNYKLTFLPKQEDEEGTGKFTLYMVPVNGWAATTTSDEGKIDLNNTFYGIKDKNITFTFADAKKEGDKIVSNVVKNKQLTEDKEFIDSKTYRKVIAAVNFGKISSNKVDKDGNKVDYTLDIDQDLQARFACWETANTYAWGTHKEGTGKNEHSVSNKPSVMWNAEGAYKELDLSTGDKSISVVNSYDPMRFSGELNNLIGTNKYLKIKDGSAHFTYGTGDKKQIDPYFKPTIAADGKVTLTNTQIENAPTADHDENLEFVVIDCYGHEKTLSFSVTVLRPAKK